LPTANRKISKASEAATEPDPSASQMHASQSVAPTAAVKAASASEAVSALSPDASPQRTARSSVLDVVGELTVTEVVEAPGSGPDRVVAVVDVVGSPSIRDVAIERDGIAA
jgi:hypothetical protein